MSTYKFSKTSLDRLATCHPDLQRLFNEVIKHYDCTILCGYRGQVEQDDAFLHGRSKLKYPHSKHNQTPSLGADVMPYPVDWSSSKKNLCKLYHFVGYVLATADMLGIKIRCGADFNQNKVFFDDNFVDIVHFELY
jgi:peptidoglycan LD-endopeptidase CwlK